MRFPLLICVLQWAGVLGLCPAAQAQQSHAQITTAPVPDSARLGKVSPLGKAHDWSKLESFAKTMTKEEFEKAWRQIYSEEIGLPPPFQIGDTALDVPTGNTIKPIFRLPFRDPKEPLAIASKPSWRRARDLAPLNDRPPLSDLHIAIDPGHIGGQWAAIEERLLSFKPGEAIREGDLSLMTAKVLKERLFKLGAVVSLVRETLEPVTPKRPADFEVEALEVLTEAGFPEPTISYQGLTGDAKLLTVQWQTEKLFYRVSEIHARAERVNQQIKPDMVLCLHFNAEAWGDATSPQFSPKNHLHVMINGCYAPVELEQQDVRYEMLSRLLNRVHEEELPLATSVAESMARATGLPAYIYTRPNARHAGTNPYVYARNLLANRLYECPVLYLEPFVMNHEETYRRLLAEHYLGRTLIGGKLTTSAIEDYVRGVIDGLLAYYKNNRQP